MFYALLACAAWRAVCTVAAHAAARLEALPEGAAVLASLAAAKIAVLAAATTALPPPLRPAAGDSGGGDLVSRDAAEAAALLAASALNGFFRGARRAASLREPGRTARWILGAAALKLLGPRLGLGGVGWLVWLAVFLLPPASRAVGAEVGAMGEVLGEGVRQAWREASSPVVEVLQGMRTRAGR